MMRTPVRLRFVLPILFAVGAALWLPALAVAASTPAPTLEESLIKARVNGKYRMLLRQFKLEKDAEEYGDFKDLGYRDKKQHGDQTDLPAGHWVYVKPYWYIWRDLSAVADKRPMREWGPEQATGEPNTNEAGDIVTAWASASQDDQDEWLMLEYAEPVVPTAVDVYETFNPGALYRVTAFNLEGEEIELWKGDDPTAVGSDKGVSQIPVKANFKTNRIKIYIASKAVAGWNEIDAVGLHDKNKTYWATAADASSTYAQPFQDTVPGAVPGGTAQILQQQEERIRRLELEIADLKTQLDEMKKLMKKEKDK